MRPLSSSGLLEAISPELTVKHVTGWFGRHLCAPLVNSLLFVPQAASSGFRWLHLSMLP